jgi:hypothetical protein
MKRLVALWIPIWLCPFIVAQEHAKFEVFGGYSLEHISTCGSDDASCSSSSNGPASTADFDGWNASITGYVYKFLGATADFSGHKATSVQVGFSTSVTRYSYMFGPVVAAHLKTITPFAHVLFGGTSNNYNGAFGASYKAFTWFAGRLGRKCVPTLCGSAGSVRLRTSAHPRFERRTCCKRFPLFLRGCVQVLSF